MTTTITKATIRAMLTESLTAGDWMMARICRTALATDSADLRAIGYECHRHRVTVLARHTCQRLGSRLGCAEEMTMSDPLDRLSPSEAHLPPSARTWARVITVDYRTILELRDPNDGLGADPATRTRHQYLVARGGIWKRRLPPAPLDSVHDVTPRENGSDDLWRLADIPRNSHVHIWATDHGFVWRDRPRHTPREITVTDTSDGGQTYEPHRAWQMPPTHPTDHWADITDVRCPHQRCRQTLVWYEAGYVPGYRVCMATIRTDTGGAYDPTSIRHRFRLAPGAWGTLVMERRS